MPKAFDRQKAAKTLVDAIYFGDRAAAESAGVSLSALENWRLRLRSDTELEEFFREFQQQRRSAWAAQVPEALASCIEFSRRAGLLADPSDPKAIRAICAAIEMLSDVWLTEKMLGDRVWRTSNPTR